MNSLESLKEMFDKSYDTAKQVVACSVNQHQAEAVVQLFVKQVASDFRKVKESIDIVVKSNLTGLQDSGATSIFGPGPSEFELDQARQGRIRDQHELTPQHIPAPHVNMIDDDAPTERSFVMDRKRETKHQGKKELALCKRQRWTCNDI
jgi:hypothetical protein